MGLQIKRSTAGNPTRLLFPSSKEIYLHEQTQVDDLTPCGMELDVGEHSFTFSVPLPDKLPSSFRGSNGCIKYKMRFIIRKAWSFDERYTVPFIVRKKMLLTARRSSEVTPVHRETSKSIIMFGCKSINLSAFLPVDYAICGESLRICVNIYNDSIILVEKLRFSLIQQITYYIHEGFSADTIGAEASEDNAAVACNRETVILVNKETGPVEKKSERHFAHLLQIPLDTLPTDEDCSSLIRVSYVLRVEAILRGFFKNLVTDLPFTLYLRRATDAEPIVTTAALQDHSLSLSLRSASLQSDSSLTTASSTNSSSLSHSFYESPSNRTVHPLLRHSVYGDVTTSTPPPSAPNPPQRHSENLRVAGPSSTDTCVSIPLPSLNQEEPSHSLQDASISRVTRNAIGTEAQSHEFPPSYEELFGISSTATS